MNAPAVGRGIVDSESYNRKGGTAFPEVTISAAQAWVCAGSFDIILFMGENQEIPGSLSATLRVCGNPEPIQGDNNRY
jgi:hypothetical protein